MDPTRPMKNMHSSTRIAKRASHIWKNYNPFRPQEPAQRQSARMRQSTPRHAVDALPAGYGFRDDVTFYTAHGDVFGWACVLFSFGLVVWLATKMLRLHKI